MSELVMTEAGAIGHGAGSTITGGVFTITSVPSGTVKAEGSGVFSGDLLYTFAGGAQGNISGIATTAPQTISPTATKVKADGALVIRLGDSGTMAAQGVDASGAAVAVSGPVEVTDAGQTKVNAT
ncbi:MAG: hypothetical protein ACYTEQ_21635 [Planctomycetota bacterium]